MIRAKSILLLILILITQCNQKDEEPGLTGKFPAFEIPSRPSSIYGEWKDNSVFMYSANFKFNKNGTFDFHDHGCTGCGCSKGNWTTENGMIVLTSFDEYKENDRPHSQPVVTSKEKLSRKNKTKEISWSKKITYTLDTSFFYQGPLSYNRDSIPLYFDKRKFVLSGDTLFGVTIAEKFIRQ